ncbi:MAG: ATP-grasp domain-containing protein [Rhodobacteraceae bacterium]|nr:ATP-grasp domain-containing protein [Paracoccaceae bacterium]
MFGSVLIANRGEIACRIVRTARRLGMRTIAIHSEPDADAQFVHMADRQVSIGIADPRQCYLDCGRIVSIAREQGADCVHPGYGFLAENAEFADAVRGAGMAFVGPTGDCIRLMGSKFQAKRLMAEAGVPVIPGHAETAQDDRQLLDRGQELGFPVLIKPIAGGGGRGMRVVESASSFMSSLKSARAEAMSSFGDAAVMIEKLIVDARHIEVQVFADSHGSVVHLFDRDCSLQRRYQKLVEEAPATTVPQDVRNRMFEASLRAARAAKYTGAGTVEFLVGGKGTDSPERFWFIEMNTRLQVEHPVTEEVTGIDLVEWQFRIAFGEELPLKQDEIVARGHAIEARICAEQVEQGFLPAVGQLSKVSFPHQLRVEAGVRQWDRIAPHYDSMIAKLIATGSARSDALQRLREGLRATRLRGVDTNLAFLGLVLSSKTVSECGCTTDTLAQELAVRSPTDMPPDMAWATAAYSLATRCLRGSEFAGFALWGGLWQQICIQHGVHQRTLKVRHSAREADVVLGNEAFSFQLDDDGVLVSDGVADHDVWLGNRCVWILRNGVWKFTLVETEPSEMPAPEDDHAIRSPMPGIVREVRVEVGDFVSKGDVVAVVEAMKMEHVLTASRDGKVLELRVQEGGLVEAQGVIAELSRSPSESAER